MSKQELTPEQQIHNVNELALDTIEEYIAMARYALKDGFPNIFLRAIRNIEDCALEVLKLHS